MNEFELLHYELKRQQAHIGVLTQLCVTLLRTKPHAMRKAALDEFRHACDALIAATLDNSAGTDVLADEIRELRAAIEHGAWC
ncbi:hypothetical protein [Paraburkholderia sacchari]|uniref:hypothetical protein n=1 Tax=Paraburkholderia sacchari TaxID=159450 RepID=UPI001BCDC629|nr:hypothetical protein [Paraburkholderia sacchari]